VNVIAYDGRAVLDDDFRAVGASVTTEETVTRRQKFRAVQGWLRASNFDVVHCIMKRASSLTLLARWPARRPPVIASDYSSATYGRRNSTLWLSLASFAMAEKVATEIELNRKSLERLGPWLRSKTVVVRNGLDTDYFTPAATVGPGQRDTFIFCAVGTLSAVKNPLRVVDAVAELRRRGHFRFRVEWYGRDGFWQRVNSGEAARTRAASLGLDANIVFCGETSDVVNAYRMSHAMLHASTQEGFPNAVAEGMACGLPLAVSRVSDLPLVVAEADNGFVFDETDPCSIADAMERLMALPEPDRVAMGERSRDLAVRWFGMQRYLDEFEGLYYALSSGG
jgi:glycosyltransferase involved in cell wall biosynthesis